MSNARNLANLLGTNTTIQTAKIADDAVTAAKIPAGAVAADIADGEITTAKLADDAVTSAKLDTNITIGGTLGVTGTTTLSTKLGTSNLGAGAVLQVVQTTKTDTFSTTSTSYTDVTGLSVSITPSSTSNKVLFIADLSVGGANGTDDNHVFIQMVRGSTAINIGDARGSNRKRGTFVVNNGLAGQMFHCSMSFLDSPSTTSATTYKIQMLSTAGGITGCVNRSGRDADDSAGHDGNAASTITVMEIAG